MELASGLFDCADFSEMVSYRGQGRVTPALRQGKEAKHENTTGGNTLFPCLLEMDNVKAVYQKYHEKGFEIVGLSFDRGRQPWINAIVDHQLNWIHLSDLKYWNSEASVVYGISSIPANILLDGNGIIVATDLRGEELLRKMRQIFRY